MAFGYNIDPLTGQPKKFGQPTTAQTLDPLSVIGPGGISPSQIGGLEIPGVTVPAGQQPTVTNATNTGPIPTGTMTPIIPGSTTSSSPNVPAPTYGQSGMIQGLDANADPSMQQFSSYLAANGGDVQKAIDQYNAWVATSGAKSLQPSVGKNNTIGLNNGTYLVAPHTGGNNSDQWQVVQRGNESGGGGDTSGSDYGTAFGKTAINPSSIPGTVQAMDPQIHDAIMKLLTEGQTPPSATDPIIKNQVDAYRAQQDRSRDQGRAALAERAAYEGTPTSTFDTQLQNMYEQEGQNVAGFQANLIGGDLQARRQQVVDAIQFAQGADRTALQLQLANIDNALREQGLGTQNQQFYDTLSSNIGMNQADLQNAYAIALLNG